MTIPPPSQPAATVPGQPETGPVRRTWLDGTITLDVDGPRATVTLADPKRRNAQHPGTWRALTEIGRVLPGGVRVLVLRGEGPSFCSGLDRRMLTREGVPGEQSLWDQAALDDTAVEAFLVRSQSAYSWLGRPDVISIAAVHGHAIGAGFQLALACDIRIAAEDVQFCMRETSLGLVPDLGGTKAIVDLVGYARALEICVTGRFVGAAEAERIGLVNAVVPTEKLAPAVADLAAALLAPPRDAVIETKALLLGAGARDLAAQRAAERQAQTRRFRDLLGQGD